MRRALQFFFSATIVFASIQPLTADLSVGQIYPLKFIDVSGTTLLIADGHVTIVVLTTPSNLSKPRLVGDRVPDSFLGNPIYRMITVVRFGQHSRPVRALLAAGARRHLNVEAKRVQPRYDATKIARNPRSAIFAVADFDGSAISQLNVEPGGGFRVFIFGRSGKLLAKWNDAPSTEELIRVLK